MALHANTVQGLYSLAGDVVLPEATPAIAGWRYAQYDGIVALAAVSLSGEAGGGDFDDGCAVDRRDWHFVGWSPGDRIWNSSQGIQLRQYPDRYRCGCGLHPQDHALSLGDRSGVVE